MPSSKGVMVLIFGLCCHPRALWYSYLDYAVIQGPYGTHIPIMLSSKGLMVTHIWIMPSSKGLTECKALLEMQKGRKKKKKLPYVLYGQTILWNISFLLQNGSCFLWTPMYVMFLR